MRIDSRIFAGVVVVVALVVVWMWWRGRADPDLQRIEERIRLFEEAVEADDPEGFKEGLALDFGDPYGHDRDSVTDRVFREVQNIDDLDVVISGIDIDIDRKSGMATVKLKAELNGQGAPRDPDTAEERARRRIRLQFKKQGSDWLVRRADVVYSLL